MAEAPVFQELTWHTEEADTKVTFKELAQMMFLMDRAVLNVECFLIYYNVPFQKKNSRTQKFKIFECT